MKTYAWYLNPCFIRGIPVDRLDLWEDAVYEVAKVVGDEEAIRWVEWMHETKAAMHAAGLFVGDPKPSPEERERLYARLDALLGISA